MLGQAYMMKIPDMAAEGVCEDLVILYPLISDLNEGYNVTRDS
jgi:hypothetical protein